MDRDESLVIAELQGWKALEAKREGVPILIRNNSIMWHHPTGVTVAETESWQLVGSAGGALLSAKYTNHRHYRDLEEALNKEP